MKISLNKKLLLAFGFLAFGFLGGREAMSQNENKNYQQKIVSAPLVAEERKKKERPQFCISHTDATTPIPLFNNVDRVVVMVDVGASYDNAKEQEKFPEPLRKANLENLLKTMYENRYSELPTGVQETPSPGCYDRNGQPVIVINLNDKNQRKKFNELSQDKGTLTAWLTVGYTKAKFFDPKLEYDLVSLNLIHYRSDPNIGMFHGFNTNLAIPLTRNAQPNVIRDNLKRSFQNKIW